MPGIRELLRRSRTPIDGPEKDLCDAAMAHRLPTDRRLGRMVFREPRLPTGFPDIVAVYPTSAAVTYERARRELTDDHIRVMHYLNQCRGASLTELSESLARPRRRTVKLVNQLEESDMVICRGQHVSPRALSRIFVAKRIVAIEFKISDWMKAIHQAVANMWFASHSYILIRPSRAIAKIRGHAEAFGVGVLVFDGSCVHTDVEAVEHEIPASYGSWMVNEWTLHRLHKGDGVDRHW